MEFGDHRKKLMSRTRTPFAKYPPMKVLLMTLKTRRRRWNRPRKPESSAAGAGKNPSDEGEGLSFEHAKRSRAKAFRKREVVGTRCTN